MGKTFDLTFLDEDESAKILNVLENDFQLRMKERERLGKLRKKISDDDKLASVLTSQKDFNEKCCIRCYKAFFIFVNPRIVCFACRFNVCKDCCTFVFQFRSFVCITCQKEKDLMAQSCDWFYETIQRKFRQCGSAKVARRLTVNYKNYQSLSSRQKIAYLLELLETMEDPWQPHFAPESGRGGRERMSVLNVFSNQQESPEDDQDSSPQSSEFEPCRSEAGGATDFHVRPSATAENSQKEVLRRMKALQMARFHERVHEAMSQMRATLKTNYPHGLPTVRDDLSLRNFIRKSRDELTIILKNFSQILAITIESHNLALGRSSEDVQIDIQHILQDEVEGIVSHRVDVQFDDAASMMTDEGSKMNTAGTVEQRLAAVILRKVLDDYRAGLHHRFASDEEEALQALDALIDEVDIEESHSGERASSSHAGLHGRRRPEEVDPDLLSLSNLSGAGSGARRSNRSRESGWAGSQHSGGSGPNWVLRGRAADSFHALGRDPGPRVGGRAPDELSDLSGGSLGEEGSPAGVTEGSSGDFEEIYRRNRLSVGQRATPWAGTSNEETKNELLRQLRQQDSGIGIHYDSSPPSSLTERSAMDSEYQARHNIRGLPKERRRIETLSRDILTANQNAEGAAAQVDATAEQYTPSYALRRSSDQGVAAAARALRHLPPAPAPKSPRRPVSSDRQRAQMEEDVDKITTRVGIETRPSHRRSGFDVSSRHSSESGDRRGDPEPQELPRTSGSEVTFGVVTFDPQSQSRDAWDDYRMGTERDFPTPEFANVRLKTTGRRLTDN